MSTNLTVKFDVHLMDWFIDIAINLSPYIYSDISKEYLYVPTIVIILVEPKIQQFF